MKKVAVLFPAFLGGGAEAVCAWMLEALKEDFKISLITLSDVSLAELDAQYGTMLERSRIEVLRIPLLSPFGPRLEKSLSMFSLRQFYLSKYYKEHLANKFDLAISAFNEIDFGHRGIQYIHFPMFGAGSEQVRHIVGYPDSKPRRAYKKLLKIWSGWSDERMRRNITLVNSRWTAELVREIYGIDSEVVYPPIILNCPDIPWHEREDGFVLISRIVREKNIEVGIKIVSEIRKRGFDVHLHIIGGVGDSQYKRELKCMTRNAEWVIWEKRLPKVEYAQLIARHKYGVHTRRNEQFGIGIAEMVMAGVIPFVPSEGGQVEIVGNNEGLLWRSEEEAVDKIERVLRDPALQEKIRNELSELSRQRKQWSVEHFKQGILRVVQEAIEE